MNIVATLAGISLLTALIPGAAHAQNYPSRDITFMAPHAPGASTDHISRQFSNQLEKVLSGNVNVENKPGGSGTIMVGLVAGAKPDGHTIGLGTNSALGYQPLVNSSLSYKTPDDYQTIVKLVDVPTVIAVRADSPWKTFDEFLADVKKNPGKIRASVSGLGTTTDMVVKQFNKVAGVKITTVPLTGGGGEAVVALLGGRVEAYSGTGTGVVGHVQAGKLRVIGVFMKGKYDLFPEATSIVDAGYNATLASTFYVIAPKGMPKAVQDKLAAASLQVVKSDEYRKFARDNGYVIDPKGPEESKAELTQQIKDFADLVKFIDQK